MALQIRITKGDWWLILIYCISYRLKTNGSFCCFSVRIQLISDIFRQNCCNASKTRHHIFTNRIHEINAMEENPNKTFSRFLGQWRNFTQDFRDTIKLIFPAIRLEIPLYPSHFPVQLLSTFCTLFHTDTH